MTERARGRWWRYVALAVAMGCAGRHPQVELRLNQWPMLVVPPPDPGGFRMGEPGHQESLGKGWSMLERDTQGTYYRWAVGDTAELFVGMERPMDTPLRIRWVAPPMPPGVLQGVEVRVNGIPVGRVSVGSRRFTWAEFTLPGDAMHAGRNVVQFLTGSGFTLPGDDRSLRFCVREVRWGQRIAALRRRSQGDWLLLPGVRANVALGGGKGFVLSIGAEPIRPQAKASLRLWVVLPDGRLEQVGGEIPVVRERSVRVRAQTWFTGVALEGTDSLIIKDISVRGRGPDRGKSILVETIDRVPPHAYQDLFPVGEAYVTFPGVVLPSPLVVPCYASMLSGFYPFVHGILDNSPGVAMSPQVPTVARLLAEAGYRCVAVVADGRLGPLLKPLVGFHASSAPYEGIRTSEETAEEAVRALMSHWGAPEHLFFWVQWSLLKGPTQPELLSLRAGLRRFREACIAVGLLGTGVHAVSGGPPDEPGDNLVDQLRERRIRVRLALAGRGAVSPPPGRLVSLVDLAPTLLDLAGVARPGATHGVSLLAQVSQRGPVFCEGTLGQVVAVVNPPWKLIQASDPALPPPELAGGMRLVRTDGADEESDLISQHPEVASELSRAWMDLLATTPVRFAPDRAGGVTPGTPAP